LTVFYRRIFCVFVQGTSGPDPTTVYVDMRALRHDRQGTHTHTHALGIS